MICRLLPEKILMEQCMDSFVFWYSGIKSCLRDRCRNGLRVCGGIRYGRAGMGLVRR
jgi:hypothetical protein